MIQLVYSCQFFLFIFRCSRTKRPNDHFGLNFVLFILKQRNIVEPKNYDNNFFAVNLFLSLNYYQPLPLGFKLLRLGMFSVQCVGFGENCNIIENIQSTPKQFIKFNDINQKIVFDALFNAIQTSSGLKINKTTSSKAAKLDEKKKKKKKMT